MVHVKDHHRESARLVEALVRAGHILVPGPPADLLLIDLDPPEFGYRQFIDRFADQGAKVLLYPHGAGPLLVYDGLYEPYERVDGNLVIGPGQAELMRRMEYPHPTHAIGWTLCEQRPFRPAADVRNVLFAPTHPNGDGSMRAGAPRGQRRDVRQPAGGRLARDRPSHRHARAERPVGDVGGHLPPGQLHPGGRRHRRRRPRRRSRRHVPVAGHRPRRPDRHVLAGRAAGVRQARRQDRAAAARRALPRLPSLPVRRRRRPARRGRARRRPQRAADPRVEAPLRRRAVRRGCGRVADRADGPPPREGRDRADRHVHDRRVRRRGPRAPGAAGDLRRHVLARRRRDADPVGRRRRRGDADRHGRARARWSPAWRTSACPTCCYCRWASPLPPTARSPSAPTALLSEWPGAGRLGQLPRYGAADGAALAAAAQLAPAVA